MIKIRIGTFETNSSSVHTLCIATDEEWRKLKNEELLIDLRNTGFITLDEAINDLILYTSYTAEDIKNLPREIIYSLLYENYIAKTLSDYTESEYLEYYEEEYITPKGEKLHVFGLFGRDS